VLFIFSQISAVSIFFDKNFHLPGGYHGVANARFSVEQRNASRLAKHTQRGVQRALFPLLLGFDAEGGVRHSA